MLRGTWPFDGDVSSGKNKASSEPSAARGPDLSSEHSTSTYFPNRKGQRRSVSFSGMSGTFQVTCAWTLRTQFSTDSRRSTWLCSRTLSIRPQSERYSGVTKTTLEKPRRDVSTRVDADLGAINARLLASPYAAVRDRAYSPPPRRRISIKGNI